MGRQGAAPNDTLLQSGKLTDADHMDGHNRKLLPIVQGARMCSIALAFPVEETSEEVQHKGHKHICLTRLKPRAAHLCTLLSFKVPLNSARWALDLRSQSVELGYTNSAGLHWECVFLCSRQGRPRMGAYFHAHLSMRGGVCLFKSHLCLYLFLQKEQTNGASPV